MKTITRGVLASGALLALVAGSLPAMAQDKPELRIAAIIAVTGPASSLGAPERRAVELFEREYAGRDDLPFTIRVVNYDDASDPTTSVSLTRKAIEEDRAHVVVCCSTTPSSLAIIESVTAAQVPMISMASSATIVEPASERPFSFKTPTSDHLMLTRTLNYMKREGIERIGFFGLDDSYGETGLNELRKVAAEVGIELLATEHFSRQDTNFTPQALRMRQVQPDAVYIHAIPPSANLAHEALGRVGYDGPIYHGAGASINAFIEIGKEAVEGAIVGVGALNVYDQISEENPLRPVLMDFAQSYDGMFGAGRVDLFAGQAWDGVMLSVHGFGKALEDGADPADLAAMRVAIRDALESTQNYIGVNGVFDFGPDNHLGLDVRSTFLARVEGGRFVLLEE